MVLFMAWLFFKIGLFVSLVAVSNNNVGPVELFVIKDTSQIFGLEQQRERIKLAERLQPIVQGDSLAVPADTGGCPAVCVRYVEDFVEMMNRHVSGLSPYFRRVLLDKVRRNSVRENVVKSYVRLHEYSLWLTLTKADAKRLGVEREYGEVLEDFESKGFLYASAQTETDSTLLFEYPHWRKDGAKYEFLQQPQDDTSVFVDLRSLNEELDAGFADIKQAFQELNEKYESCSYK